MDLSHVLWIGGGQGSGTSALAQALAQRFDLALYAIDEEVEAHAARMPRTELHEDPVQRFVTTSRHRFRLVLEDLAALPPGKAVVEGSELLPTSVAAVLRSPDQALFLVSDAAGLDARIAREASDLRLKVLRADRPVAELVELAVEHFAEFVERSAAQQIGGGHDDPHHETE